MRNLEVIASEIFDTLFPSPEPSVCDYELVELESCPVSSEDTWHGSTWHMYGDNITEDTAREMKALLSPLKDKIKSTVKEVELFVGRVDANLEEGIGKPYLRIRIDWGNDFDPKSLKWAVDNVDAAEVLKTRRTEQATEFPCCLVVKVKLLDGTDSFLAFSGDDGLPKAVTREEISAWLEWMQIDIPASDNLSGADLIRKIVDEIERREIPVAILSQEDALNFLVHKPAAQAA